MSKPLRPKTNPVILQLSRQNRRALTPAERRLWEELRDCRLNGFKFRRQHPIGRFIGDFYCDQFKLIVEIDGPSHLNQAEYDAERTQMLQQAGVTVLRFENEDVHQNLVSVLTKIIAVCERK